MNIIEDKDKQNIQRLIDEGNTIKKKIEQGQFEEDLEYTLWLGRVGSLINSQLPHNHLTFLIQNDICKYGSDRSLKCIENIINKLNSMIEFLCPNKNSENTKMEKQYLTEIREYQKQPYLKVFIRKTIIIEDIRGLLSLLDSVRKVNITSSESTQNPERTLTVYPKKLYDIKNVQKEIEKTLERYFNGGLELLQQPHIVEMQDGLINYPKAKKKFNEAIEKYKKGIYKRNILDDMRLSLELFLKEFLNNEKSLENQISEIGKFIKEHNSSCEFTNMFQKLLEYYSRYQNDHVKHDDNIKSSDIDFIINLTALFIRYFIKMRV